MGLKRGLLRGRGVSVWREFFSFFFPVLFFGWFWCFSELRKVWGLWVMGVEFCLYNLGGECEYRIADDMLMK